MQGREFLDVAVKLAGEQLEADWRTAAGRAYYALMQEGRAILQRWGITPAPREELHRFVHLRFVYAADADLKDVGRKLEQLGRLRNQADYQIDNPGPFNSAAIVKRAVALAKATIALLDQIQSDSNRQAAAMAAARASGS